MRGLFFVLMLLLIAAGSAVAMKWNVVTMDGRRYVPITDVAKFYRLTPEVANGRSFRLTSPGRKLEGSAGAREVRINGVKYVLCFRLIPRGNRLYLSAMDVTKIIEPVLRPGRIKTDKPLRTVILDAGHGGHDSGAVGRLGQEKAYVLDVALRARKLLLKAGFRVKMTRTTDVFVPLEKRSAFANQHPDAVFVSIHFNKSRSGAGTCARSETIASIESSGGTSWPSKRQPRRYCQ